jgi:chemotaxis protein CheX
MSANESQLKLELSSELATKLSEGVCHILQTLISEAPKAGAHSIKDTIELKGDISGIVTLSQPGVDASCFLIFSSSCIYYILEKFYAGRKFNNLADDSVRQGVGELTNIIFGTIKSKLNDAGFSLKIGLPKVIIGMQHIVLATTPLSLYIPFDMHGQKMEIMLTLAKVD